MNQIRPQELFAIIGKVYVENVTLRENLQQAHTILEALQKQQQEEELVLTEEVTDES